MRHDWDSSGTALRAASARVTKLGAALLLAAAALFTACDGKSGQAGATQAASAHADHAAMAQHQETQPQAPDAHADHAVTAQAQGTQVQAPNAHAGHVDHQETLAAGALPGTSLFHMTGAFTAQDGAEFTLPELRGHPSVVVMFYGDCTTACPLLVKSAQDIEAALPADVAAATQFVMVSFDTDRDTPDKLRAYADDKGLDKDRWHWLIGSPLLTRQLATLLGVQYRDGGNGVFAHSNLVTVLDADGVPTARLEGLGVPLEPALAAIRAAVD